MGKLVRFEKRQDGSGEDKTERAPGEGEILIFTGVRYERDAPTAPTKPTASRGSKRKRG